MSTEHNIADYEEVLAVLPESFQDYGKDNPDVLVYLSELGSLGLQRLSQEPERLNEEKSALLEQTQDLAFHNYKTFIQAAECSQKIFQDFNIIETRLDSLLNKLPPFKGKCSDFSKQAQQINARWHQASSTLSKHPQLLEFLEMPQLMDNYVRTGCYDEALELSAYVKRLERKHSDISLVQTIVADVRVALNVMLTQLLSKLRSNIQLPECLKVVGYLRRMDVFDETELRIKFLQARDAWFQKVIGDIEKGDLYTHIMKVIENSRIHLFDIITQYRAIFSDDDPLSLVRDNSKCNSSIFHSWVVWKISWFLSVLKNDISSNLGGRIDSVLAQCMYFGLSFSRVNIDFRSLLLPIFQNVMLSKFRTEVDSATFGFIKNMHMYVFSSYTNTTILMSNTVPENSLQPPNSLLDFYPLAQYCNDVLGVFNELKLCPSFAVASDVTKYLSKSISKVVKTLVDIHNQKYHKMSEIERKNFMQFCFLVSSDLLPHFNKCLNVLFSSDDISRVLGITSLEFKKIEFLCKLDIDDLLKTLNAVLPPSEDDDVDIGLTMSFNSKKEEDVNETSTSVISNMEESEKCEKNDNLKNKDSDNNDQEQVTDSEIIGDTQQTSAVDETNSNLKFPEDSDINEEKALNQEADLKTINEKEQKCD
ncbi:conserved oligomeric Golgi complex subunit 8-like [Uloborus diversus]|uniref:conserved oligomeric Golgi complex subunit 8-like n=1 Tax=Uloborus diversus TaxID=327109 RepID=UPI00240984F3|nr:conserved oligomeric Golgi complex subunit 8-like [Uloborus diversus]